MKNVKGFRPESLDEAKELAAFASVDSGTYLDGSFRINEELLEELRKTVEMKERPLKAIRKNVAR